MTKLERLQLENDIQQWIQWNMPDLIEQKLLDLFSTFSDRDDVIVLMSTYKTLRLNPEYRSVWNGMSVWNNKGTRALAGILSNLIDLIEVSSPNLVTRIY